MQQDREHIDQVEVEMAFFSISKTGGVFLFVSTLASAVVGYHVHINDNYMLDVVVNNENKTIEFRIQAINVKGWVGIGVNDKGKDMVGGDLFIGGFNANGSYGGVKLIFNYLNYSILT